MFILTVSKSRYLLPLTACPIKPEIHLRITGIRGESCIQHSIHECVGGPKVISDETNVIYSLSAIH